MGSHGLPSILRIPLRAVCATRRTRRAMGETDMVAAQLAGLVQQPIAIVALGTTLPPFLAAIAPAPVNPGTTCGRFWG